MKRWLRLVAAMATDRRGAVSLLTAFALPALIATLALGTEVSFWLVKKRGLQNAADSAVIAASIDAGSGYLAQARAVSASYGLIDGKDGVSVTASNTATCPTGETGCYSVKIAATLPTFLGAVVGYAGAASTGSASGTMLSAIAFAKPSGGAHEYCLVALASDGRSPAVASSGAPKADLSGCGIASNTAAECNGHDLGATFGDAVGSNSGCGAVRKSYAKPFADPFAARAANLPTNSCGSYPQTTGTLPSGNKWSGTKTLGSVTTVCGDLQLTGNVTVKAPSDAVLILRNGDLLTNNYRIQTASGSALAVVFTGTNNALYGHVPSGGGTLDLAAPTSGVWSGVALYQDPSLTVGVQVPSPAASPKWSLSGLIYLPHADLAMKGSVGKGTNGKRCTVIVANSIDVKGTGLVLSTVECGVGGLGTPTSGSGRGALVG